MTIGPISAGGVAVTNLYARINAAAPTMTKKYVVSVLDNGTSVLSCEITAGSTTCINTGSVTVAAGHFLQVSVTLVNGAAAAPTQVSFRR